MIIEYVLIYSYHKVVVFVFLYRPTRQLAAQVSIDDRRRFELANILQDKESREAVRIIKIIS